MISLDLVLRDGEIFTPSGKFRGAIGVEDGKISLISNGWIPKARNTINLKGKVILPGFIDTHVHFRDPGFTNKEDFHTGSCAAAAGGITCVVEMPNTKPPIITANSFIEKLNVVKNKSVVDFALYGGGTRIEEIPAILDAGAIGIKLFLVADPKASYPHDPKLFTKGDGLLYHTLKCINAENSFCAIHPGNQDIFLYESKKCWANGNTEPIDFMKAYFGEQFICEDTSVSTIIILARAANARTHILHLRSNKSFQFIKSAKDNGLKITSEVNPKYMLLGEEDMKRLGPLCMPYGLSEKQRNTIWDAVNTNIVDVLASDHAPHTEDEMQPGWKDAWSIPFGNPQLDHFVSILLTKANEKFTTIENIVEKCSENPAKLLGIYPRKGVIQVGSDADFTIIDPQIEKTLSDNNLYTKVGWSPYKNWQIKGCPVMTVVRGHVVMQDGKITVKPGFGEFISGIRA